MPRARPILLLVGGALALFAACSDGAVPRPCTDIPPGGCPLSRGVACEDPACEAVYLCREGNVWELSERCPDRPGRPDRLDASADAPTSTVIDASADAPPGAFGGPGCVTLLEPDCPLGLALACGVDCCGCEDLFVCEDRGWTLWGTCGDAGATRGF